VNARHVHGWMQSGTWALGVDVANSEEGDEGAIARGRGRTLQQVESFPCPNANDLGFRVVVESKDKGIDGMHVGIDSVGVGAGAVNEAKRLDFWVRALNGGERPIEDADAERFNNLRSQMWWQLREDLRTDQIDLPPDLELAQDLTTPTWQTKNGKIVVESKEDLVERLPGRRSPNKGDASAYWNWVRAREEPAAQQPPANAGKTVQQLLREEFESLDAPTHPAEGYTVIRQ
jgi:hypothetical protein